MSYIIEVHVRICILLHACLLIYAVLGLRKSVQHLNLVTHSCINSCQIQTPYEYICQIYPYFGFFLFSIFFKLPKCGFGKKRGLFNGVRVRNQRR